MNTPKSWSAGVDYGSGIQVTARLDMARGPHAGLVVGRQTAHVRYELEYEAGRIETERQTIGSRSAAVGAKGRYQALFANAYRVEPLSGSIDCRNAGSGPSCRSRLRRKRRRSCSRRHRRPR